jgi:hypothetical protein
MAPKKQDLWPFTRVPDWYKSAEAREMEIWECLEATKGKIHADCIVGLDTVCLLYNWVDDGVLPMSWLQQRYPKVHAQVVEWAGLAEKESAAKDALARELHDAGVAYHYGPPNKKSKTSTGSMQDSEPSSLGASASTSLPVRNNATASGTVSEHTNPVHKETT